ncbi:MAG: hypothetical protein Q7J45_01425 [bacterium]|nr:hypothetical protein [bacterium]
MFSRDPATLPPKARYKINQSLLVLEAIFGASQVMVILIHWLR